MPALEQLVGGVPSTYKPSGGSGGGALEALINSPSSSSAKSVTKSVSPSQQTNPIQNVITKLGSFLGNEANMWSTGIANTINPQPILSPISNTPPSVTASQIKTPVNQTPMNLKVDFVTPSSSGDMAQPQLQPTAPVKNIPLLNIDPSQKQLTPEQMQNLDNSFKGQKLSQAPPQTVWGKISSFVGDLFNSPEYEKARAANAVAIAKDPAAADAIQKETGMPAMIAGNVNPAVLPALAQKGGNPMKNTVFENITKQLGIRNVPTTSEIGQNLMTIGIATGLIEAAPATILGLGLFSAVNELKSGIISAVKGDGFKLGANQTLSDLFPNSNPDVKNLLDVVDFLGTAKISHSLFTKAPDVMQLLTKDVVQKYNMPTVVNFSKQTVRDIYTGLNTGEQKDLFASLGLSSDQIAKAAKQGISIQLPSEKLITITDKPYWAQIKSILGKDTTNVTSTEKVPAQAVDNTGAANQTTNTTDSTQKLLPDEPSKALGGFGGKLQAGEYTPHDLRSQVINSGFHTTEDGQALIKASLDAEQQGKNIVISRPDRLLGTGNTPTPDLKGLAQQNNIDLPQTFRNDTEKTALTDLTVHPNSLVEEYIQKYGSHVNADNGMSMFKGYNGTNTLDYSKAGGNLAKLAYNRLLTDHINDGNKTVLFSAGGTGSGKSTAVRDEASDYAVRFDSTMSDYKRAEGNIKKALDKGYAVDINYVYRDPIEAYTNGVLRRYIDGEARTVPIKAHINSHIIARETVLNLAKEFKDNPNVHINIYDNNGALGEAKQVDLAFLKDKEYNKDELTKKLYEYTKDQYTKGNLTKEQYNALTEGTSAKLLERSQQGSSSKPAENTSIKASEKPINSESRATITKPESTNTAIRENDNSSGYESGKSISEQASRTSGNGNGLTESSSNSRTISAQSPYKRGDITRIENQNGSGMNASKGAEKIGNFEVQDSTKTEGKNLKLFEKVKDLTKKYARQIGEGYLPRNAAGVHFSETQNIRINGMNDLAVASHEISHFLDQKNRITDAVKGNKELEKQLTNLYVKYYPTAQADHPLDTRVTEGFATLLQKYIEMPSTIETEFPNLVKEFLQPGGTFYKPVIGSIISDLQSIVSEYQGLSALDQIGTTVAQSALKTDKKAFLNFGDKIRTFLEDEIYPIEKVGEVAGVAWTGNDPSLWMRQYSRGGGIYANNILNDKTGYWGLDESGDFKKMHDFNWKTLEEHLKKEKIADSFDNYLIARDQYHNWVELDKLQQEYNRNKILLDLAEQHGLTPETIIDNVDIAKEMGLDPKEMKTMLEQAIEAKKMYEEQKEYLHNNPYTRDQVTTAYLENQNRFTEEEKVHDVLVKEDLKLLHNPLVQLVNNDQFTQLSSKQGYASMKRQFYDELVGDSESIGKGVSTTGANKVSSLLRRSGGQQQVLSPVYNAKMNHIEAVKKAMKQIVYNKIAAIAEKGVLPDLLQHVPLKTAREGNKTLYPQDKDENIIMARKNFVRQPILVDKMIRQTVDASLTYQSMNIFEHLAVTAGRVFTIGTTGAYAPFSLVNFPADQWNAVVNTRNNYLPVLDSIKLVGQLLSKKNADVATLWHEWEILGGDRMTLFQSQMGDPESARKYILDEKNGIQKVLGLLDKGVDILSIPSKYSETISRFTEYAKSRQNGKSQIVALEEAGRVTAPFHHIGSWKFGNKATGKFVVRSVPFGNAALQVFAQTVRTGQTKKGAARIAFAMLTMASAYLASMALVSQYGAKDQKEQYKDLRPQDISQYIYFPAPGGHGLLRIRVSQELSTIGSLITMVLAQNLLGAKYSMADYRDALTAAIPRQFDVSSPVQMFFSWFNPVIKVPIELLANFKDYPTISPIENQGMQNKAPQYRFNEATSALAKKMGAQFNISPVKIDFLIQGLLGRTSNFFTGKPGALDPTSQIYRQYMFTLGRRIENYYNLVDQNKQDWNAVRPDKNGVIKQRVDQAKLNTIYDTHYRIRDVQLALDEYKKVDPKDTAKLEEKRTVIINKLSKMGIQ